ncbi:MAG: hypothetical protein WBE34_04885 [Candidatus Nitrosopolaris sp.]
MSTLEYKIGLKPINCMLYEFTDDVVTSPTQSMQSMQLAIDECGEWIWDTLDSTKDCGFEYIKDENKEFLTFNTNDSSQRLKHQRKIRKTTNMELVHIHMNTHYGIHSYGLVDICCKKRLRLEKSSILT